MNDTQKQENPDESGIYHLQCAPLQRFLKAYIGQDCPELGQSAEAVSRDVKPEKDLNHKDKGEKHGTRRPQSECPQRYHDRQQKSRWQNDEGRAEQGGIE